MLAGSRKASPRYGRTGPEPKRTRPRTPAPIQFDLRVSAEAALAADRHARYRKLTSNELLTRIVERVFSDNLVKAVLDD